MRVNVRIVEVLVAFALGLCNLAWFFESHKWLLIETLNSPLDKAATKCADSCTLSSIDAPVLRTKAMERQGGLNASLKHEEQTIHGKGDAVDKTFSATDHSSKTSHQTKETMDAIDTCAFRRYASQRYYHLSDPTSTWPQFLSDASYIFGEAPLVLRPHPSSSSSSSPPETATKFCVDQSEWYPGELFGPDIHPFSDGTNPSIVRIVDNPLLDESYATRLRSLLPENSYFLVVLCSVKSICVWRETEQERQELRLGSGVWDRNYVRVRGNYPNHYRTTILAVDRYFRTVAQMVVRLESDIAVDHFQNPNRTKGRAILDDPRLFTSNGEIRIASTSTRINFEIHHPLHISKIQEGNESRLIATVKASEAILPCCGRNLAFIDGNAVDEKRRGRLDVLTWPDPLTVENTASINRLDPVSWAKEKIKAESPFRPKQSKKSHFHGTNGFLVYLPQTREFLGVGHIHRPPRNTQNPFSMFGHHYTHAWYTIGLDSNDSAPFVKYTLRRVSSEFVFPSHHRPDDAEIVQFASGLEKLDDGNRIVITYGINDCEGAVLTIPWSQIDSMLRPIEKGKEIVDVMKPITWNASSIAVASG